MFEMGHQRAWPNSIHLDWIDQLWYFPWLLAVEAQADQITASEIVGRHLMKQLIYAGFSQKT